MQNEGNIITKDLFEKNLNLKLQENSFLDDIGPLLSHEFKQNHSLPLLTQDGSFLAAEKGNRLSADGWNLVDAAEEIKGKILVHLPK